MGSEEDAVTQHRVIDARARNISHNVQCTECESQSIEDSQADIAILLRKLIRDDIRSGKSDKKIFKKLEDEYGENNRQCSEKTCRDETLRILSMMASERRCQELITHVPESTRPLLRQIETMQETISRSAEAWAAVERSLNSRLQEAETKAATAEVKERSINERLSQTLSRVNVLEAQILCLRAEQTQLTRSLEKERQRAAESRQEYLAAKEEAGTQDGRAKQLEEEIRELRRKHKQELQEVLTHRELLQQELEREKNARLDLERTPRVHP